MSLQPEQTDNLLIARIKRYGNRWSRLYRKWQFWLVTVIIVPVVALLQASSWLPQYFKDHSSLLPSLAGFLIVIASDHLPGDGLFKRYFISGRRRRNFLRPELYIVGLLGLSVVAQLLPIYTNLSTHRTMNGLVFFSHYPLVISSPLLYLLAIYLVVKDYTELRYVALCMTVGGYFMLIAFVVGFTDIDADIPNTYIAPLITVVLAPLLAGALCVIPPAKLKRPR